MYKVFAINGSPRQDKGNTQMVLSPFLQGLEENGADVQLFYARQLLIKPCTCGNMFCWNRTPGECIIKDSMQEMYPLLKAANLLILATPKYIPFPGGMQNFINRLCPLLMPRLELREGHTRAEFRKDVRIEQIVLVSTGGWWEWGNVDCVQSVVKELAAVANVKFGGTIFRPHAQAMREGGEISGNGRAVLAAVKQAAYELINEGEMKPATLAEISQPLIPWDAYFNNAG